MNHQNIETAVIIEKETENLNSYEKIDQFIGLCNFCYLNRCENIDCSNCRLLLNLKYLFIEDLTVQKTGVDKIQKFCRFNYGDFVSMRTFLHFSAGTERKISWH